MSGKDQIFFIKYFLPSAMLKTYQAVHKTASVIECLNDLFSLGSGSVTYDLFPEVVGVCCLCAGTFENLRSDESISDCNKFVIIKQFENSFKSPNLFSNCMSLEMAHAKVTLDIIEVNDKKDLAVKKNQFQEAMDLTEKVKTMESRKQELAREIQIGKEREDQCGKSKMGRECGDVQGREFEGRGVLERREDRHRGSKSSENESQHSVYSRVETHP